MHERSSAALDAIVALPGAARVVPYASVLATYLASRLLMAVVAAFAALARPDLTFRDTITIWDGLWYRLAAETDYPAKLKVPGVLSGATSSSFFPGYPLLVRAAHRVLPVDVVGAGLLVSLGCGAAAVCLIWRLTALVTDEDVAHRMAALMSFAPGSFVFSLMYAEGLMMVAAAACLIALVRERWLLAGVFAAVGTATRPNAIALCAACAVAAVPAAVRRRDLRPLIAPLLSPLGLLAFFAYLRLRTGNFFAWSENEHYAFGERVDYGETTLRASWRFFQHPFESPYIFITGLSVLAIAAGTALLLRTRLPLALKTYALTVALLVTVTHIVGPRPRFLLVAFPLAIPLALRCRGKFFFTVLASSAVLMALAGAYYIVFFILPGDGNVVPP